jgi:cytochrome c oxidase subunit II
MPLVSRSRDTQSGDAAPGTRVRRSRYVRLLMAGLGALLAAAWPAIALANPPRPNWNPGPPWGPLDPHSSEMLEISNLFWIMLVLSAIVFVIVTGFLILNIVRFTAKPGQEVGQQIYGSRRIELAWTAIPFLILIAAFGITVKAIHDINTPPAKLGTPLNIVARGHQWWWEFYYPSLKIETANEVHVPVGTSLHFHVESADVVHSYWVPTLQRQIDANPGQDNAVFVTMNKPGTYDGMCYEYCGDDHAWMKFRMVVQTKAQFKAWAKHEKAPAASPTGGLAAVGATVFFSNTCVECHAITGTGAGGVVGPNLTHLASRWTIGAGAAPMTLRDAMAWVRNPNTYKPGVLMPPYPNLSRTQLRALATYLLSLK